MTEGGVTRMKRNGARIFKNPPQPHMCIQDFIQGTAAPCYVNVLSWEKIELPNKPSQPVPLYGGMRVKPPRTKAEAVVFAVMAHPEVLRINGKNADDPKLRSTLIELLLDFVEAMNPEVLFTRQYTILKDRDITGELKEVWNAVQARRDREQPPMQQETWIDAQPPVPHYPVPQCQEQQHQEYASQPPQYHSTGVYRNNTTSKKQYERYYEQDIPSPVIPQMYQRGQIVPQRYHGNVPRIAQDRYNYRERGRDNMLQNILQQNCPAYPAPQYQFQQLPRQMVPQYVNSNVYPSTTLGYGPPANANVNPSLNTNQATPFQPYIAYQQRMDNPMHVDMRRMPPQQHQQQQQQMHMNHVHQQYEPTAPFNVQTTTSVNVPRLGRPHMGVAQKNNASKRQGNSPTHSKQSSCTNCQSKDTQENSTKPKSPVKVLQRELPLNDRQDVNSNASIDSNKVPAEKSSVEETKNVQVTDLDEDVKKDNDSDGEMQESSKKLNDTHASDSIFTILERETTNFADIVPPVEEKHQETKEMDVPNGQSSPDQKNPKSKIIVIKGNKHKESTESNKTIRIRFVSDQKNDSPKRSQTTVNSIIKSVFKIHPGISGDEASSKRKSNGQAKGNVKAIGENDETQHGYTILKKSESISHEELVSEIAEISIQDCKDVAEVSPVLS